MWTLQKGGLGSSYKGIPCKRSCLRLERVGYLIRSQDSHLQSAERKNSLGKGRRKAPGNVQKFPGRAKGLYTKEFCCTGRHCPQLITYYSPIFCSTLGKSQHVFRGIRRGGGWNKAKREADLTLLSPPQASDLGQAYEGRGRSLHGMSLSSDYQTVQELLIIRLDQNLTSK